jgi:hypothetical protein
MVMLFIHQNFYVSVKLINEPSSTFSTIEFLKKKRLIFVKSISKDGEWVFLLKEGLY